MSKAKTITKKIGKRLACWGAKPFKLNPKARHLAQKALTIAGRELDLEIASKTAAEPYQAYLEENSPTVQSWALERVESEDFKLKPKFSLVMPVYNPPEEEFRICLDSILSQSYPNWEFCIADDASTKKYVRKILEEYAQKDPRIKLKFRTKNGHISAATNSALSLISGDYVIFIDNDDLLWTNALYEFAKDINNKNGKVDIAYADSDHLDPEGKHIQPFFKPGWSPDMLTTLNYITHPFIIRTDLPKLKLWLDPKLNGAQDWDFLLRAAEVVKNVSHIPKILYSWRMLENSTASATAAKPYVVKAQKDALDNMIERRGWNAKRIASSHSDYRGVHFNLQGEPKVSIIIPSINNTKVLKRCIESIYQKSTYSNFEIILVDTGSTESSTHKYYKNLKLKHTNFKLIKDERKPFNYSAASNLGVAQANGEYFIFLNNDTEVITPNWIERLTAEAQRKEVGAVGCKLYYPGKKHLQHTGIILGVQDPDGNITAGNQLAGIHIGHMQNNNQHIYAYSKRNVSAVTGACLCLSKLKFNQISGFDEPDFGIAFSDVDLCLRLIEADYTNLYLEDVELIHHESLTLGDPGKSDKRDLKTMSRELQNLQKTWGKYLENDPFYNPNFTRKNVSLPIKPSLKLNKVQLSK